jgi:phosphoglycolate phosphatase
MLQRPEMVLIDVDGTLVDSVPDLAFCVDEMLKQLDMPARGEASVTHSTESRMKHYMKKRCRSSVSYMQKTPQSAAVCMMA